MVGPHLVFESLAYATGFALYRSQRRRRGDFVSAETRLSLLVAVVVGALVGAKLLHHLAHPAEFRESWRDPAFLLGGKTIVGGLLGGWIAVELLKRRLGIQRATGDVYALPLAVGIAIGRIGCFLAGPADDTFGRPTQVVWGVAFADGVPRHPTPLYEIAFLSALAVLLWRRAARGPHLEGSDFRLFLGSYLAFRFAVDFLKPLERFFGLGVLQMASLLGLAWIVLAARRRSRSALTPRKA